MDVFDKEKRSNIMSRVKGKNTKPEMRVRSLVHQMGYRFRLHRKNLPGKPDLVFPRHKKIILVHGCFWHGHDGCPKSSRPSTNIEFWQKKLDGNISRDRLNLQKMREAGWQVLVIWECQTKKPEALEQLLKEFFEH
ncbi:MAG: DNA mismatch endonuclease Vsr [bacterium]|nr:DNA mismatch endonuclease Vsr [bacterium]